LALASELCTNGEFPKAETYLSEIEHRNSRFHLGSAPHEVSRIELSEMHVLRSVCIAEGEEKTGRRDSNVLEAVDKEMETAADQLQNPANDREREQLVVTYSEWAMADEQLGKQGDVGMHLEQARDVAKKLSRSDPQLVSVIDPRPDSASPAAELKDESLPRRDGYDTYVVTFPDKPEKKAVFLYMPADLHMKDSQIDATIYMYDRGLFERELDWQSYRTHTSPAGQDRLDFVRFHASLPIPDPSEGNPMIRLAWDVQTQDKESITGVQSEPHQPPLRFVAKLSPRPSPPAGTALFAQK
jgi:hypothetical protein